MVNPQLMSSAQPAALSAACVHDRRLHVVRDGFLYAGTIDEVTTQRHSVVLYLALTDEDFEIHLPQARLAARAAVLSPGVRNRVVGGAGPVACIDIGATHRHFSRLARAGFSAQAWPAGHFKVALRALTAFGEGRLTHAQADELYTWLAELAIDRTPAIRPTDERVREVMRLLRRDLDSPTAELAAAVGLSESWLVHLFHREVGITLRQYERTLRLQLAAAYLKSGVSLTEVAAMAGFADLAHFSKMWKVHYGFAPQRAFAGDEIFIDPIPSPACIESLCVEQRPH